MRTSFLGLSFVSVVMGLTVLSCARPAIPKKANDSTLLPTVLRNEFNHRAVEQNLPLFWRNDDNHDGVLQPDELEVTWRRTGTQRSDWVQGTQFTSRFKEVYRTLAVDPAPLPPSLSPEEARRRERVRAELRQGLPTLVSTDLTTFPPEQRLVAQRLLQVAARIEALFALQNGSEALREQLAPDDPASQSLFLRNQGPLCIAPRTEKDPDCHALASHAKPVPSLYPPELRAQSLFCEALSKAPNAKALTEHFSAVLKAPSGKGYQAVPYSKAFAREMEAIALDLEAAAAAQTDPQEQAFKAYLEVAAKAFRTNDWYAADAAWVRMNASNSRWYLRVAPDEVYWDPCASKAGFAMTFALINPDSVAWQAKLNPVKAEMEKRLATLAGAPYKPRDVKFALPDFIDVVLNAGESRTGLGATVGQSLPNWGPVAAAGGRTLVMSNLFTDTDSLTVLQSQRASLLCPATMARISADPKAGLMEVVLHEAAHNLGPSHEYKVRGQTAVDIFGGPLASMLEELKAQSSALVLTQWLQDKALLTKAEAEQSSITGFAWMLGHIARGMYTSSGEPRPYSHLAAIQLGEFLKGAAVTWNPEQVAANGNDKGCFDVDMSQWGPQVDTLARTVLGIKARGDKAQALKLKAAHVDAKGEFALLLQTIAERWTRAPKSSFVYAVRVGP